MLAAQECTNGFSLQFDDEGTVISLKDPITKVVFVFLISLKKKSNYNSQI